MSYTVYAAKKYCVDHLTEECRAYLQANLCVDNMCTRPEQTHLCGEDKLSSDCLRLIMDNPRECLYSKASTDLCQSCECKITDSDDLKVTEQEVYEALIRLSEGECCRQNLQVTDANSRDVSGDLLYSVRFSFMDKEYFVKEVIKGNVLVLEDIGVVKHLFNHRIATPNKFKTTARKHAAIKRFNRCTYSAGQWNHPRGPDAISFRLSKDACFHGIVMYGCCIGSAEYRVTLQLYDALDVLLDSTQKQIVTDQTRNTFDVMFDSCVMLKADAIYTVVLKTSGNVSNRENGRGLVKVDQITLTFINSKKSDNFISVNEGQTPCLLLSSLAL